MRKLFKYVGKYKWWIFIVFAFTALRAISDIMIPTIMANIIDIGIANNDIKYIVIFGVIMLIVSIVGGVFSVTSRFYAAKVSVNTAKDLRAKLFKNISYLSFNEIDKVGTASLITRTTNDITQIQNGLSMLLRFAFLAPLTFISTLVIAISKNATLTMIILVPSLIFFIGIIIVLYFALPLFKKGQKLSDKLNLVIRERLTGVRVIRAFAKTNVEKEKFRKVSNELKDVWIVIGKIMSIFSPFFQLLMSLISIAIVYFGSIQLNAHNFQVGELIAFLQYGTQLLFSMFFLLMIIFYVPRAMISLERVMEVIDMESEIKNYGKIEDKDVKGDIEFNNVDFYYSSCKEDAEPAIEKFSTVIKSGTYNAIIGSTGSGKSTIIKLMERFYDVTSGEILIDGVNIKEYTNKDLKNIISLSPQKAQIISGTLRSNIDINNNLTDEEIIKFLKIAGAYEFVSKWDDFLNHELNQSGTNLSGGQKQRISIARAIAKKSKIYIFDDTFSALDNKTEKKVKKAVLEYLKDKTVIIIAQKIESIKFADNIIVLDEAKLISSGKHDYLKENCEIYKEIILSQEGIESYE